MGARVAEHGRWPPAGRRPACWGTQWRHWLSTGSGSGAGRLDRRQSARNTGVWLDDHGRWTHASRRPAQALLVLEPVGALALEAVFAPALALELSSALALARLALEPMFALALEAAFALALALALASALALALVPCCRRLSYSRCSCLRTVTYRS